MDNLASCYLRIDRAGERIQRLKREVAAYRELNKAVLYKVVGLTVAPVGTPTKPPPEIGVTCGEIVYNLRAALDYLVFQLVILATGEVNMRTQFPIEDSPEGFKARRHPNRRGRLNALTGVDCGHCAAIEALQPYNGVNWTGFLRDISNEDKHRMIPVFEEPRQSGRINAGGTDDDAKALGGFRIPGDDVSMYFPAFIHIFFRGGAPVVEMMEVLHHQVRAVIDSFVPEFTEG